MKLDVRYDQAVVPVGAPSVVHVLLTLTAPKTETETPRSKLNLAAVIDHSGSMDGEPLEYAKESVNLLLDQLRPDDRFSLVIYDDEVLPLVEGAETKDKTHIKSIVDQIASGGCTNLSGGWLKGIELVNQSDRKDEVKAVLLLTDGLANAGITEPDRLVSLGKEVNDSQSIRTTCMGLGQGFDEDLLSSIATAAGGRFHYIESPEHAPAVFEEELGGLLEIAAQNIELDLKVADGAGCVTQLTGFTWKEEAKGCKVIVGDLSSEQVKHVLLAIELPPLTDLTDVLLASLKMTYAEVGEDSVQVKSQKLDLVVGVSEDEPQTPPDPEVLLHIGLQRAAQARREAIEKLDEGNVDDAVYMLDDRQAELRKMASKASDPDRLNEEAGQLELRARELREEQNIMESRKFMVAEDACMSMSNYDNVASSRKRRNR